MNTLGLISHNIVPYKWILINLLLVLPSLAFSAHPKKRLLLYQRDHGERSMISPDAPFFLHPNGSVDWKAEWEEMYKRLDDPETQCLYPARYNYLKAELGLKTPIASCPALESWKDKIRGEEVSVIFAAQFVSNPASVMGHTFLKFTDSTVPAYLHRTIGYAAEVDDNDSAIEYAVKGLSGGYKGRIFENPYYEKVHEYKNMEQRDIWEFTLKLTAQQKEQLLNLIWELKTRGKFNYYFLDENCSYMILAMLEAIVPDVNLTEGLGIYTAPYMTLQKLNEEGLIKEVKTRPSIRAELTHKFSLLTKEQKKEAIHSWRNLSVKTGLSPLYYDTLIEASLYEKHKKEGQLSKEHKEFLNKAMIHRSSLPPQKTSSPVLPSSPVQSHKPYQLSMGGGRLPEETFYSFEIIPGIHRLNDRVQGFLPHSSITFLNTMFRYLPENHQFKLGRLDFVGLQNTNLYHPMDPKLSWKINLQYRDRDLLLEDKGGYEGEFLIGGAFGHKALTLIFLQGLKEQISKELSQGHITWLKSELMARTEADLYTFSARTAFMKAIWNGPHAFRLDSTIDLRFFFPKQHLQIGPSFSWQQLLYGKISWFENSLQVSYDF